MGLYEALDSGIYKCPLRTLNIEQSKYEHLKKELQEEKSFSEKEIHRLEKLISEKQTDIQKCREGYDFSLCKDCKNEYYLTGKSLKCCENIPIRI